MEKKGLSLEAKHKMANITAVCTILLTLFFGVLIYKQSDQALPLILGSGALIYGPLCFILYLIEVAKGVFKNDEDEDEEEESEAVH